MDLETDLQEPVDVEPDAPQGGAGGAEGEFDTAPSGEPALRQDNNAEYSHTRTERDSIRDDAVASQARFYQEELERTRQELQQLRAAQRPDPREEQARLEAMDPEQRITYLFERQQQESRNQVATIEARTNAQIDQLKFESQLTTTATNLGWSSAKRAQYAAEIEAMYNNLAQRNMTIPRGDLLKHRLGDELMNSGAKAVKKAAETGKANIARQSAKMTPASSNVSGKSTGMTAAQASMKKMLEAGVLEM